ncbi:Tail Collar domain protein [Xylanimonas cellulosilytica DSM 15894]|uniref:Tail Collar domain protein n=1 Tax=Xylanimonas cellulosilytica (strain DSM 15894 / JCM 12276 / CECT 5975 / KCTC 9989 / LMG 20990 / NBRC 107835 / XIL07) TaxID=446471 RepID=D1BW55_XYLCX|nr:tail fiber protein [Xylanimonas cellulosilytica]ACZ29558.1 Tail Collar domain protein [Xylanimonas cellulosilytica DSM 15894]
MASGIETSGPITGEPWTEEMLRIQIGAEAGIVADTNGSAYSLTLPTGSDVAEVGSATLESTATVAGFAHRIPQGSTQSITIPASSNGTNGRTDVIALKYDPSLGGESPGPIRLARIAGTEGSAALPTIDEGKPGVEYLPLWAVTRKSGQSLNQAAKKDLRRWTGPNLFVPAGASLPTDVPLGTHAHRDPAEKYTRVMSGATPTWARLSVAAADLDPALKAAINAACPVGMEAGFHTVPPGWLEHNGAAVSRTTYPALFAHYGTTYGAGDGSTTFNLPNAKGRTPVGLDTAQAEFNAVGKTGGAKTHTLSTAEMPSHTHTSAAHTHSINHDHAAVTSSSAGSHTHGSSTSGITDRAYFARGSAPASSATVGTNGVTPGPWDYVVSSTLASAGAHTHTVDLPSFSGTSGSTTPGATGSTGSGSAHNNLPPYLVRRWCVRALPVLA